MSRLIVTVAVCLALPGLAIAQIGNSVGSGLGSDSGTLHGANVNNVNGINANGTPKSQSPGASMTVGAGNSTMTPGVSGGVATRPLEGITTPNNGIATPTITTAPPPLPINGVAPPPPVVPPGTPTP